MAYGAVTRHLAKRVAQLEARVSELEQFVFTEYQIFLDVCCPRGPDGLPLRSALADAADLEEARRYEQILKLTAAVEK